MVNRIWQGHFSEGLVRTTNNFGITGERPTHPELLDWLSTQFIEQGWSVKKMHKLIMLSSTYQMDGEATPLDREKDPDDRLLTRFPMRRKTVEEIRDSLLALDGSLDLTMGGTLQKEKARTTSSAMDARASILTTRSAALFISRCDDRIWPRCSRSTISAMQPLVPRSARRQTSPRKPCS